MMEKKMTAAKKSLPVFSPGGQPCNRGSMDSPELSRYGNMGIRNLLAIYAGIGSFGDAQK